MKYKKEKEMQSEDDYSMPVSPSSMQDKEITCACGTKFTFSVRDQIFFEKNKYSPPKRCKACRLARAKERERFGQV